MKWKTLFITLLLLVSLISTTAYATLMETNANVNYRTGPSTSYSVIKLLPKGTSVEVITRYNTYWYKVSALNRTGYISARYLTDISSPATHITTGSVNFRTGPSTSYTVIRKLSKDTKVSLVSKYSTKWYKVSVGGQTGYVSTLYLREITTSTSIPKYSIGYAGSYHKQIADLRPYLEDYWNGNNYMSASQLQVYLDKNWLVTWGTALYNNDGKTTMILGHGSTAFSYMSNLKVGSLVSVSDLNGRVNTYKIIDVMSNPNSSFYLKYDNGVSLIDIYANGGIEEAISIQMCQDWVNTHYYGILVK